jgi:hypothetical protein
VHKKAEGDPVTRIALGEAHLSGVGAARPTLGCVFTDPATAAGGGGHGIIVSNVGSFIRPRSSRRFDLALAA